MARKKKNELPSGNFRVQISYKDEDGNTKRKSFTAQTRKEAEYNAQNWLIDHDKETRIAKETVRYIINQYIDMKDNVLSPSTVREYRNRAKADYDGIADLKYEAITNQDIQKWVNDLAKIKSPKSVRNIYALLTAALGMARPDFRVKVTLPAKIKPQLYTPSDEDVQRLIEYLKQKEHKDLLAAVLLGAFAPLRRSEACALTAEDLVDNSVVVNKAMVMSEDGWVIKPTPKTYSSNRVVEMPPSVMDFLRELDGSPDGRLISATPDQITHRFERAIKFSRSPKFRFHDLRHYSASILHAIGVPNVYVQARGGWATDNVLKAVYLSGIDAEKEKQNKRIIGHFENLNK